jgi:hypothetical protein
MTRSAIRPHNDYDLRLATGSGQEKIPPALFLRPAADHRQGAPVTDRKMNESVTRRHSPANKTKHSCKQIGPCLAREMNRADGFQEFVVDPESMLAREWDREHREHVIQKLLAALNGDFVATTWAAFCRLAHEHLPAAQVAEELGTLGNAVLLAKLRGSVGQRLAGFS